MTTVDKSMNVTIGGTGFKILPRRVKITDQTGVWFATAPPVHPMMPDTAFCKMLTRRAIRKGVKAIYEPATEDEYQAYRKEIKK